MPCLKHFWFLYVDIKCSCCLHTGICDYLTGLLEYHYRQQKQCLGPNKGPWGPQFIVPASEYTLSGETKKALFLHGTIIRTGITCKKIPL